MNNSTPEQLYMKLLDLEQTVLSKSNKVPTQQNSRAQLSTLIKSARDIMRKDAGLNGDLDRLPQLSWVMFLKCYDDLEKRRCSLAVLEEKTYREVISPPYRWRDWASDPDKGKTGPDFLIYINDGLLPYLRNLTGSNEKLTIASLFAETYNRMLSGYLLRDVVNLVNSIHFESKDEIFTLSHLYESMLKEMRDAAGDSGEFYTPRPVVKFIVDRVSPRIGEKILDPACGTGGFLVESFEYLKPQQKSSADQLFLQRDSLFGIEKKPLPYLLGTMNLLLHGIDNPNIRRDNGLKTPLKDIGDADRYEVIMTNPPFGGVEEAGIQLNFPEVTRTSETALLFSQFIIRSLKAGGRCGMVVHDGLLSNLGVASRVKETLLHECNLHTIVRLPFGVFEPYTRIRTNLLFFDKGITTEGIWFYEIRLTDGRKKYTKTKPIRNEEFSDCKQWWTNRIEGMNSWYVPIKEIEEKGYSLDFRNPNAIENLEDEAPEELLSKMTKNIQTMKEALNNLSSLLSNEKNE